MEEKYKRLAEVKNLMSSLEAEEKSLKEELLPDLTTKPEGLLALEGVGTFSLRSLKTWEYPPQVKQKEIEFKDAKKKAEESGEATFEEKKSLVFKPA